MEHVKIFTQSKLVKNLLIALLGSILLAISSKIKIPFYPVPMTMQTLVVLSIGIVFGWKLGIATIALYLFEGIIGLPVFSVTLPGFDVNTIEQRDVTGTIKYIPERKTYIQGLFVNFFMPKQL